MILREMPIQISADDQYLRASQTWHVSSIQQRMGHFCSYSSPLSSGTASTSVSAFFMRAPSARGGDNHDLQYAEASDAFSSAY